MAAAGTITGSANPVLRTPAAAAYIEARTKVHAAPNLKAAIDSTGMLAEATPVQVVHAHQVLDRMPADVDAGFMADLKGAMDAESVIEVVWEEHPTGGYDHSRTEVGVTVTLVLRTPNE
jgi:hypothetical protein